MKQSSQKFIGRNRPPRVQIEYDIELYGAEKKIQLPFVMGVLADFSGVNTEQLAPVEERPVTGIDSDNFDACLAAMQPRVAFTVPNTLTGDGSLQVDLTFQSMDDFSPAALVHKIEPLARLLEARTQLNNLEAYMSGKAGAAELIAQAIRDPALLQSLTAATVATTETAAEETSA